MDAETAMLTPTNSLPPLPYVSLYVLRLETLVHWHPKLTSHQSSCPATQAPPSA